MRVAARGIAAGGRIELSGKVSLSVPDGAADGRAARRGERDDESDGGGAASPSSASSSSSLATDIVITDELISQPYVDMTIRLMTERFGAWSSASRAAARRLRPHFRVPAGQRYTLPRRLVRRRRRVLGLLLPGRRRHHGRDSPRRRVRQRVAAGRRAVRRGAGADGLRRAMGARRRRRDGPERASPSKDGRTRLGGIDADCVDIPDAAMTLAVAALFAEGKTTIRNVGSW